MTITLESIQATQAKLANMIAAFQKQPRPVDYCIPEALIELQPGERYAGIALDAEGEPLHHLILLPGEGEELDWHKATLWADEVGGELPTRQEQSLLFANLRADFKSAWYWSSEPHSDSSYAWYQRFGYGGQGDSDVSAELRARAVRRLVIQ